MIKTTTTTTMCVFSADQLHIEAQLSYRAAVQMSLPVPPASLTQYNLSLRV